MIAQHMKESERMLRKKKSQPTYTEATPCATCKYASRMGYKPKYLAPFMSFCTNTKRNNAMYEAPFSSLVYTHTRSDMRVPEQQCNEYEAKQ
jgi:hypothetical protein